MAYTATPTDQVVNATASDSTGVGATATDTAVSSPATSIAPAVYVTITGTAVAHRDVAAVGNFANANVAISTDGGSSYPYTVFSAAVSGGAGTDDSEGGTETTQLANGVNLANITVRASASADANVSGECTASASVSAWSIQYDKYAIMGEM